MRLASLLLVLLTVLTPAAAASREQYPEPEFGHWQQLANWEERQLKKADEAWANTKAKDKRWALAAARYAEFCDEFPESIALPYALYRQGRCHHLNNKRKRARQYYDDIIEFFPDDAPFACAAAFYKGLSHMQDSDGEKAMPVWALIPKHKTWRQQPLAGYAILALSEYLWGKGQPEKAAGYLRQLALDFRRKNPEAAGKAIRRVQQFHILVKPNEPQLRAFFVEVRGFGKHPIKGREALTPEQALEGTLRRPYWDTVRSRIKEYLRWFPAEKAAERKAFAGYWAGVMRDKNQDWDDFQLFQAYLDLLATGSREGFVKRLDEIFESRYKKGDNGRVLRWMAYHLRYEGYRGDGTKFKEYFQKLVFDKMTFDHLKRALELAYASPKDAELLGGIVKQKVKLDQLTDGQLVWLAEFLYGKEDKTGGLAAARAIGQPALAIATEFKLVAKDGEVKIEVKEGLAEKLYKEERYASDTYWTMGDLYRDLKQYPQAINAYHRSGKGAASGFAAADCHWRSGKLTPAIGELEAIVGMFRKEAPKALLTMAHYYHKKGKEAQRNESLIRILTGYKETPEWSKAHVWAEDLKLKFRGETERD